MPSAIGTAAESAASTAVITAGLGTYAATISSAAGASTVASFSDAASHAAVSVVNNKDDLSSALKDVTSVSYDMVRLLTGDPSQVAIPSQGKDRWGSVFVTDDQIILATNITQRRYHPNSRHISTLGASKLHGWIKPLAGYYNE